MNNMGLTKMSANLWLYTYLKAMACRRSISVECFDMKVPPACQSLMKFLVNVKMPRFFR